MGYGIGRVPRDVDPVEEVLAQLEAARIQPPTRRPSRPKRRCRRCRQEGYAGEYPFSTLPGSGLCDDCV